MRRAAEDVVQLCPGRQEIETQCRIAPSGIPDRRATLLQSERREQAPRDGDDSRASLPARIRNRVPGTFAADDDRNVLAAREELWKLTPQAKRAPGHPHLEPPIVWRGQRLPVSRGYQLHLAEHLRADRIVDCAAVVRVDQA